MQGLLLMNYDRFSQEFNERGLLIINDFFSAGKIEEIERELRHYIGNLDHSQSDGRVMYEPGTERSIRNLFRMEQHSVYFAELADEPALVQLAASIFNDDPISMGVELFGKPARVGSEVPFHQDNAYFNLIPDHALTCWVALADATEENGCVRYIEGSHRFGNLPHRSSGVKGNSMQLTELPPNAGREICGLVRRGGAIIHHCNTIHRSGPNRSNYDRPGLLFVYKSARCQIDASRVEKYRAIAAATNV